MILGLCLQEEYGMASFKILYVERDKMRGLHKT